MRSPPEREDHGWDCFAAWPSPPAGSSVMSEEPKLKSVPVVMSPLGQYFVGRLLMLRERLSHERWRGVERRADFMSDGVLKRIPVDHPDKRSGTTVRTVR